jgi:predicted enzyme related to lactoylglutathione lyase
MRNRHMGKRERYELGTFCWVDLATTDPEGAKAIYGELFGWEAEDTLGGGGGTYTVLRSSGNEVCALYEMEAERRDVGVAPHWLPYVSVENADETAARAEELGGSVLMGAFDAADFGRMAIIEDPTGAVLATWEPRTLAGARRVNDPGCFTWNELQTRDAETAAVFYAGLFGWEMQYVDEDGRLVYVTIKNSGSSNGGIMPMTEQHGDTPPYWLTYFTVLSCDSAVSKVRELGGGALAGPLDLGAGRIAVVNDPQGAAFALFEGETDD